MFSEVSVHGLASHGPIVELESQGSRSSCAAEKQKMQEGPGPQTSKICLQLPNFLLLGPTL